MRRSLTCLVVVAALATLSVFAGAEILVGTRDNPPAKLSECQALQSGIEDLGTDPANPAKVTAVTELIQGQHTVVQFTDTAFASDTCSDLEVCLPKAKQLANVVGSSVQLIRITNTAPPRCEALLQNGVWLFVRGCS